MQFIAIDFNELSVTPNVLAPVLAMHPCNGYPRLRNGVEWHQKLSVESKMISRRDFHQVRTQVYSDDVTRLSC